MRIIEPHQFNNQKKGKPFLFRFKVLVFITLLLMIIIIGYGYAHKNKLLLDSQNHKPNLTTKTLRHFSGTEFINLHKSARPPNLDKVQSPPSITGNADADKKIYALAEDLGYQLTATPASRLNDKYHEGIYLQPKAYLAWDEMNNAAILDNIEMNIVSAYTSVDEQRAMLLREFSNKNVYTESVALGYVDNVVAKILRDIPPPGYSTYHSGYKIKLSCKDDPRAAFHKSNCFRWLSSNNYKNAKTHGWIPANHNTKTKSSELIWVGTEKTFR